MSTDSWLADLPKVELHVHLEGSMSVETVRSLSDRYGADYADIWPDGFPDRFSFDGFPSFVAQYLFGMSLLRSADDIVQIIDDLAVSMADQNIRYAEVTTTAATHFMSSAGHPGLSWEEYRAGLDAGRAAASARGVEIGWVIDIPRDLEGPDETATIDYLESAHTPAGLVAIGLGGSEVGYPAAPYREVFARAAALGLPSVPHAGETQGAYSVRAAIEELGAVRIGHGVRCLEDDSLVEMIRSREIMLEVCLTSNRLLDVVPSVAEHPLPALFAAGLRVCLNTDDPGWFATDLTTELELASTVFGITRQQHLAMQLDAVAASFMSTTDKRAIAAEIEAIDP